MSAPQPAPASGSVPRLLVIEGNTAEARARQVQFGGQVASEGYAQLLRELCPGAITDICYAADPGANLPDAGGLDAYDGIAITGSSLNIYNGGPAIAQQVELLRTAFATGVPVFGSCWGLQLITVAAGGSVRRCPVDGRSASPVPSALPTRAPATTSMPASRRSSRR